MEGVEKRGVLMIELIKWLLFVLVYVLYLWETVKIFIEVVVHGINHYKAGAILLKL